MHSERSRRFVSKRCAFETTSVSKLACEIFEQLYLIDVSEVTIGDRLQLLIESCSYGFLMTVIVIGCNCGITLPNYRYVDGTCAIMRFCNNNVLKLFFFQFRQCLMQVQALFLWRVYSWIQSWKWKMEEMARLSIVHGPRGTRKIDRFDFMHYPRNRFFQLRGKLSSQNVTL